MQQDTTHKTFIIMGVSGSGKSAIANALSKNIECAILDGDFLHPKENVEKMANGHPLNDEDRKPWLKLINNAVFAMQRTNKFSFIVCSALKEQYRDIIRQDNNNVHFLYLKGDFDLIKSRLEQRKGHFFKPAMLISQFETLEEPNPELEENILIVDINPGIDEILTEIINRIGA